MSMATATLPPWGHMEDFVKLQLATRRVPEAWIPVDPATIKAEYDKWFEELLADLSRLLWPVFDHVAGTWTAPPNPALTDADFELLDILRARLDTPIDGALKMHPEPPMHRKFFEEEDDELTIFGHRYDRYDPGLPKHLAENLTDILWTGCDRKMGSLHYQLKEQLQRPRPNQVAWIQGRDFNFDWAKTGGTPAMISGHCLQGSMGGCSAFLLFGSIDSVSIGYLQQLTVDIGDRRVFAGVHYPSDNLSSWYTAFQLLPHVVETRDTARARVFLRGALEHKSIVFAEIRRHVAADPNSAFKPALEAIAAVW